MSKQNKKQAIIDAAIECIQERGLKDVTVREITEQASVNTASINYYFGSKEEMIQQALQQHFENMLVDWEVILERQAMNFSEGLKALLREILDEARSNPNLIRAHLYEPLIGHQNEEPQIDQFDEFLRHLMDQKNQAEPDKSQQAHQLEIMQLFSGVLFPGMMHELFDDFDRWDLDKAEHQESYVEQLVDRFI
jgi:AcrR family transcriptional regulator